VTSALDHHPNEVVSHLEKAIDLDPKIADAYGRLAAAYESLGRVGDVERVARQFQKQFGQPMKRGRP
jgi:Tfp pilus assembly protein PilF